MMKKNGILKSAARLAALAAAALLAAACFLPSPRSARAATALPGGVSDAELAAYWKFDETEGGTAYDSSPFKRDLVLQTGSTAHWETGLSGGAFRFDSRSAFRMNYTGTDDNKTSAGVPYYIHSNVRANGNAKPTEDYSMTVSFLIKLDKISENTDQGFNQIFSPANYKSGFGALSSGAFQCAIYDTSYVSGDVPYDPEKEHVWNYIGINGATYTSQDYIAEGPIESSYPGNWKMISIVVTDNFDEDTVSSMILYENGVKKQEIELMNTLGSAKCLGYISDPLAVGGMIEGENVIRGFGGWMDDFMVFNRALSAAEVSAMYGSYGTAGGDENKDDNGGGGCGKASSAAAAVALAGMTMFAFRKK